MSNIKATVVNNPKRIYPVGLHREIKTQVLEMIPKAKRDDARRLLRTGEENAVIFARVSRSSSSLDTIAAEIDEEGAAEFHQKWTVSVEGYGHKSVGEHAIIQVAIENVSSLDGDRIEDARLASYTEFSARFKGRQNQGYFTPRSVQQDLKLLKLWDKTHQEVFNTCDDLTEKGKQWVLTPEAQEAVPQLCQGHFNPEEAEKSWQSRLVKHAADQFKNLLPGSRLTSLGLTVNATEGEHIIRKLLSSPSLSTREIGEDLKDAALKLAPTLVKYAEFNPYIASWDARREGIINRFGLKGKIGKVRPNGKPQTRLVTCKDMESLVLAAFLFESNLTGSFADLVTQVYALGKKARAKMLQMILEGDVTWQDLEKGEITSSGLGTHEMPPRAFEFDGGYTLEIPEMTYGDFRDYKRHRMQTYIAKPMDIKWGYMIPPLALLLDKSSQKKNHGTVEAVKQAEEKMEALFIQVAAVNPADAQYAVTRLHYRPAILHYNLREAFHLLRLRTGNNAHAFVRRIAWSMYDALNEMHPDIISSIKTKGERLKIAFP